MAEQQGGFRFPERIQGPDGMYRLVYDPENPYTVLPNLADVQSVNVSCSPVQVQTRVGKQQFFMARVEIHLSGRATPTKVASAQHLRGFRLYTPDQINTLGGKPQEVAERTPPQEMVIYIEESSSQSSDVSQGFLDAILGVSLAEQPKPNSMWASETLGNIVGPQPQAHSDQQSESVESEE